MQKQILTCLIAAAALLTAYSCNRAKPSQSEPIDSIVLQDIQWDKTSPAGMIELVIPSAGNSLQGLMYKANGRQKHPTLLLLHGFPGNERNLDLAQIVRAHGWNVVYFDYRGAWGSQGQFSFRNCVEDVLHLVAFCKTYQDSLQIDTSRMALFGHSMGGWVCLKALQHLPGIKKGFALSTWNIYDDFREIRDTAALRKFTAKRSGRYFVLNALLKGIFEPVISDPAYFNLENDTTSVELAGKQIVLLDENSDNRLLALGLQHASKNYFAYEVWPTDHYFTNKRVSLAKKLLSLLDRQETH